MLLPGFPTDELERTLRGLGFERFIRTRHARPVELGEGLTVTIHIETSISDGPGDWRSSSTTATSACST